MRQCARLHLRLEPALLEAVKARARRDRVTVAAWVKMCLQVATGTAGSGWRADRGKGALRGGPAIRRPLALKVRSGPSAAKGIGVMPGR